MPTSVDAQLATQEEYDGSPLLYNQRLAWYEWGSGEIVFSPAAALPIGFSRALMEASQGATSLESLDDLTRLVAFIHELRHFQQDYLRALPRSFDS
jgi:hypothetical protein